MRQGASVAWALGRAGWSFVDRADHRLTAGSYETLAGAAVTAEAAFLALFYTTVGVVASTAYQAVPGEIRQLFVEERAGSVYTRGVVRALVFGVIILLAGSVGYRPYALSVIVLAGLAITAIVRLMILGTDLFNFFDPATLSTPLPGRFARALALATTPATTLDEASQHVAHPLIPKQYESRLHELHSNERIQTFAAEIGIAPGIVVGRLQKEGILDWGSSSNRLKRRFKFVEK